MAALAAALAALRGGAGLTRAQAGGALAEALGGGAAEADIEGLIAGLAAKGETDDELLGMLDCMEGLAVRVDPGPGPDPVDVCGTGGDGLRTFNVSTAAAFAAAACGARVAKHGNRSSSGGSGSADVLGALGCDLEAGPAEAAADLARHGICFMFAPRYHPAMRRAAAARRRIGGRTAFNLLGPLCNPAGVRRQLVGVSSAPLLGRVPRLLAGRGARCIMSVMSDGGMDELSAGARGRACLLRGGRISELEVDPAALGLGPARPEELRAGAGPEAVRKFVGAVDGTACRAAVDTVVLNAAAALVAAGAAGGLEEGVGAARGAVYGGRAGELLGRYVGTSGDPAMLEEARRA